MHGPRKPARRTTPLAVLIADDQAEVRSALRLVVERERINFDLGYGLGLEWRPEHSHRRGLAAGLGGLGDRSS